MLVFVIIIIVLGVLYYPLPSEANKTQNTPVDASFNKNFQIKINQTAVFNSDNISITFLNVTEDSRCPEGAVCVWPGQVKAVFSFQNNQTNETFNLTLNSNQTQSQTNVNGYNVKLVKVDPYPSVNETIGVYVATLLINPQ